MKDRKQETFEELIQKANIHERIVNLNNKKEMQIKTMKCYLTLRIGKNFRKL